ncbi:MAG: hypothetical protein R3293_19835, partial [Candidatus Promineifilaceae bacterium]|nr:hypothetical protein [Candidatus Promineifilaceae bacterium]
MDENSSDPIKDLSQIPIQEIDSDIDPEQILDAIRKRIVEAKAANSYDDHQFPAFGGITYPDKPDDIMYDLDLYRHLDWVNQEWSHTGTSYELGESAISRLPLIGKLV